VPQAAGVNSKDYQVTVVGAINRAQLGPWQWSELTLWVSHPAEPGERVVRLRREARTGSGDPRSYNEARSATMASFFIRPHRRDL